MLMLPFDVKQLVIDPQAIKNIPLHTFWLMMGILSLFLIYFFYKSYKNLIKTSVLQDTPTAKIRSAAQGYVELQGTQFRLRGEPTIAPLSKTPCTWYSYMLEQYQNKRWILIEHGISQGLFELRDDTGSCIIDPNEAQISTSLSDCWLGYTRAPQPKPKNFLGRVFQSFGRYRYREWRMEEGMPLYALGNFHTVYVDKSTIAQQPSMSKKDIKDSLQTWNKHYTQFLTSFITKSPDKLSAEELSKLLGRANEEMNKNYEDPKNQGINVLSNVGLNSRMPFILSSMDQKKITSQYRLHAFLWFFGYMILLIIGGWLIVSRF